jgi:hypothetical protein
MYMHAFGDLNVRVFRAFFRTVHKRVFPTENDKWPSLMAKTGFADVIQALWNRGKMLVHAVLVASNSVPV